MPKSTSYTSPQAKRAAEKRNTAIVIALAIIFVVLGIGGSLRVYVPIFFKFEPALSFHEMSLLELSRPDKATFVNANITGPAAIRSMRADLNSKCAGLLSAFCSSLDPRWDAWVKDDHGSALESTALAKESVMGVLK